MNVARELDDICSQSFGPALEATFGTAQKEQTCDVSGRVETILDPNTGCTNLLGSTSNISIILGVAVVSITIEGAELPCTNRARAIACSNVKIAHGQNSP